MLTLCEEDFVGSGSLLPSVGLLRAEKGTGRGPAYLSRVVTSLPPSVLTNALPLPLSRYPSMRRLKDHVVHASLKDVRKLR